MSLFVVVVCHFLSMYFILFCKFTKLHKKHTNIPYHFKTIEDKINTMKHIIWLFSLWSLNIPIQY